MPRKSKDTIIVPALVKRPGFFTVYIQKDGNLKQVTTNLSNESFLDLYFTNLINNININTTKEEVIDKYNSIWKKKGIYSTYTDSWGHKWSNQMPSKQRFNEYLSKFIKDATNTK
nr:MAG TPA: hypothetical protein [Caudoviricetes sp.]